MVVMLGLLVLAQLPLPQWAPALDFGVKDVKPLDITNGVEPGGAWLKLRAAMWNEAHEKAVRATDFVLPSNQNKDVDARRTQTVAGRDAPTPSTVGDAAPIMHQLGRKTGKPRGGGTGHRAIAKASGKAAGGATGKAAGGASGQAAGGALGKAAGGALGKAADEGGGFKCFACGKWVSRWREKSSIMSVAPVFAGAPS